MAEGRRRRWHTDEAGVRTARPCPNCHHTKCGPECTCDCDWHFDMEDADERELELKSERDTIRAERDRLRRLFDDAGQGEHNVLALVEHYKSEALEESAGRMAAEARLSALEGEMQAALEHFEQHYPDARGSLLDKLRSTGESVEGALVSAAVAEVERDQLRARVIDEHNALALIDKLHADLAEVTRERDEARAERDESPTHGELDRLNARIRELEEPPVVPEGWEVMKRLFVIDHWVSHLPGDGIGRWALMHPVAQDKLIVAEQDQDGICTLWHVPNVPFAALRSLAWAIEHDQRPPHAGDE